MTGPNGEVQRALEMLRSGTASSVTEAARATGAARTTVRDRWRNENGGTNPSARAVNAFNADELVETPDENEIPVFVRDYSDHPKHVIYPIGDLHIGSAKFAEDALDEWFSYVCTAEYTSVLNTGDNTNCALSTSVSDEYGEKLTVGEARRLQTVKFRPLADADRLDAIIDGNHEMRVYRATGDSPNAAVAEALGINYSMSSCIVRYLVGDQTYDVYLRHGMGGGGTYGAAVNRLQKQETIIDADIYVSGHTHTQVAFPKDRFVRDGNGGFVRRKMLFVCSGSFLSYEDYAATAGFAPAHIGAPRIFLDGQRHDTHASV